MKNMFTVNYLKWQVLLLNIRDLDISAARFCDFKRFSIHFEHFLRKLLVIPHLIMKMAAVLV